MRNILKNNKCDLFQAIAEEVWETVIWKHNAGLDPDEKGITDLIIACIRNNYINNNNIGVWANNGFKEDRYGSDIDIFIEVKPNEFIWIAFQAKALKMNNRYNTLRDGANNEYQWIKLERLEQLSGCQVKYLLYNGKKKPLKKYIDSCSNTFLENQFGCSIVELSTIKHLALKKDSNNRYINPTYEDIHPKFSQPWKILTCCPVSSSNLKTYSYDQIKSSSELYTQEVIPKDTPLISFITGSSFGPGNSNIIRNICEKANWSPDLRIVVRKDF